MKHTKKILLTLLTFILCIPAIFFCGCAKNGGVDMPTYFNNEVLYSTLKHQNIDLKYSLKDFTHNKHDNMAQYESIRFDGKSSWLYKMYVEKLTFEIFSNKTEDIQFEIRVTNVENGNDSTTGSSDVYTFTAAASLKRNKATKVTIPVNRIIKSNSSTTSITIKIDTQCYEYKDLDNSIVNTGLKIDILNFSLHGEHK